MHSIAYDPINDEFTVPQQFAQAILTFRGGASGEERPIRIIQGSLTQLRAPDRLDVDPVHNEIFVPEQNEVLVYRRGTSGNVAPIRVLKGPDTMIRTHCCPVKTRTESAGWDFRLNRLGSPMLPRPVKWALSRKA